ncbi:MAG: lyase family protein [Phycisphaerales bacterium JB043]
MSTPIWTKDSRSDPTDAMRFMCDQDIELDRRLMLYDIEASRVHIQGLVDIGAIENDALRRINESLDALRDSFVDGSFVLDNRYEDCHSAIEHYLSERLGELGRRVHLGRSRNDQVLVALRMYMKDVLVRGASLGLDAASASLERARAHEFDPMPGYTHLQRAVPSSVGLWMASFAESFASDVSLLLKTLDWIDDCPLGTAAGYGVNLDLERVKNASRLGFGRVLINPMHAQATRGAYEAQTLASFWQVAQTIRRLAWDLSLFTSKEFLFVTMPADALTGSSIMPNKRNPDLVELLRGVAPVVSACIVELHQLLALPSGYHRDLQRTKSSLVRGSMAILDALELAPSMIRNMEFDLDRMHDSIDPEMYATDRATRIALDGEAFRDAYHKVASSLDDIEDCDAHASIAARISLGAPGNLALDQLESMIRDLREQTDAYSQARGIGVI